MRCLVQPPLQAEIRHSVDTDLKPQERGEFLIQSRNTPNSQDRSKRRWTVWQNAHQLTLAVYRVTASFRRDEQYGFTAQLRRASSSIAANLAEGCGRNGGAELARFRSIAMGSASELDYHLLLARDLKLLDRRPTASSRSTRRK